MATADVIQLVGAGDEAGRNNDFNDKGMSMLIESCDAAKGCYTVVSIIGSQSSGKSTLMNAVFNTKFDVMDATTGRRQTTRGIWAAICKSRSCTVVLDIEGTDSAELLQNDLGFENRSALFALVVSDVIFVNMWLHAVGLVTGIPLLTNIFQERAKNGQCGLPELHKTTILFVVRDYDGVTPEELLRENIKAMVHKIWEGIPQTEDSRLEKYFKCTKMRKRIAPGDLVHPRLHSLPLRDFPSDAKEIWEKVVKNKTLDLPSMREIRAQTSCTIIKSEKLLQFKLVQMEQLEGKDYCPREFDKLLTQIIHDILSEYRDETRVYGIDISNRMEQILKEEIIKNAEITFKGMLEKFKKTICKKTTKEIEHGCENQSGRIDKHKDAVISKYWDEFVMSTTGLVYYHDLIDGMTFWSTLDLLGKSLAAEIKRIKKKKAGLGIATAVLGGVAVATGGVGGLALVAGNMVAAAATGILAATATGAAAGTGTWLGMSRNEVGRSVEGIMSEFSMDSTNENTSDKP